MIQSIVFDWGGVLIEDPSLNMIKYFAKVLHVSPTEFLRIYKKFSQDFQLGEISESMLWEAMCADLNVPLPVLSSLWGSAFRHAYVENKETFRFASRLKEKGYRIGLLSNTEVPSVGFFYEQKYMLFDVVVFSCVEGTRKPEERIYRILLQRLHVKSDEVIFIDDNEQFVNGAAQVGINAVLFRNCRQLRTALRSLL
jgi:epoxide hydrolase-like predicted phosphatase